MFKKIKKRNGNIVKFNSWKISNALSIAGESTAEFDKIIAENLTSQIIKLAEKRIKNKIPSVEEIQDMVEEVLISSKYHKTAKAYIIYREEHAKIREITNKFN